MIRLIVTRGFGNGTFNGSISDIVTNGYSIGAALAEFSMSAEISVSALLGGTILSSGMLTADANIEPLIGGDVTID